MTDLSSGQSFCPSDLFGQEEVEAKFFLPDASASPISRSGSSCLSDWTESSNSLDRPLQLDLSGGLSPDSPTLSPISEPNTPDLIEARGKFCMMTKSRFRSKRGRSSSLQKSRPTSMGFSPDDPVPHPDVRKICTFTIKKPTFGRYGWIVQPVDQSVDLKHLDAGLLEELAHQIRTMEFSGKDVPGVMTVTI